jgi:hypothetical protein
MRVKAERRNQRRKIGTTRWKPQVDEQVLVKCHQTSDAVQGVTSKFERPYEGPYLIKQSISPDIYELCDTEGKVRGTFNLKHLKPYLSA